MRAAGTTAHDSARQGPAPGGGLEGSVRRALGWSTLSNLTLRIGSFAMGIFLARLLAPEQFGIWAVALVVQTVLMTLADLGLSADLVRSADHARKAPTVASLALLFSGALALAMVAAAPGTAALLGSPEAAPVVAAMAPTLLLAGAGVVPYAALQRTFQQRKLFAVAATDFSVGTAVTVGLVLAGWGPMALAVSRLVAQGCALVVQFVLAGERPKFGFDPSVARSVLRFGLPVAGANLLSWALLNIDNVAVSRIAGPAALGFYFLAFNISNWPMSALGQIVRSVSLPAFARPEVKARPDALARITGPVWAVALFAGTMLAALASPVIEVVYGREWLAAAAALTLLGVFGALRTVFDLAASFLLANGRSGLTLVIQVLWFAGLTGAMVLIVPPFGPTGAAWAHLVVAVAVVVPGYLWAVGRAGGEALSVLRSLLPPAAAALAAAGAAVVAAAAVPWPLLKIAVGGVAGLVVYGLLLGRWMLVRLRELSGVLAGAPHAAAEHPGEGPAAAEDGASEPLPLRRRVSVAPTAPTGGGEPPTVSVVIPCYNYARYLPDAVRSVAGQPGVKVEIVIVDDASTDNTLEVARGLQRDLPGIHVVSHPSNRGPVETFNDGLAHCTGEFLVRLDADDMLTPGSLRRSVAVARAHPSVGLVYGHPLHFSDGDLPVPRGEATRWTLWPGRTWLADRCRTGLNVITSPEVLMRASVVERVGGQQPLAHTHDMEMWFRIAAVSDVAYIRGADQAWHREHPTSLSARKVDVAVDLRERHEAFETLFAGVAGSLPEAGRLRNAAHRALVRDALSMARHQLDTGRPDTALVDGLLEFVRGADAAAAEGRETAAILRRLRRRREPVAGRMVSLGRRAVGRARSLWRWRRWHRAGVY